MSSGNILLVVHQEMSDPGRVRDRLQMLGYTCDLRRHACGDPLPGDLDDYAGVVVFGGPMSANDDHLPFIRNEIRLIERAVTEEKPFLGICLGAQMLARAYGAKVSPHPDGFHEIGYYELKPTDAGRHLFDPGFHVYQWHGEGFDTPCCGTHLAGTEWYPNQAMQVGKNAYGVQFHPDVTGAMMERWTMKARHRMVLPGAQPREKQLRLRKLYEPMMEKWCDRFFRTWLGLSNAPPEQALVEAIPAAAE